MATINASLPSLQDITSRMDPNGTASAIVESLSQDNAILMDGVWKEGNLPTGHQFTSRKALPSGTWRRFNEGVDPQKSRTDKITEACGMLEAYSKVDCGLAELNGDQAAYRASEDDGFIQGLSNDLETAFIYASTKTDPEKIMGLAPRLDSTTGSWGGQIISSQISHSGSDQTSIWFVGWGLDTVFGIFPKGQKGGLQHEDLGKQLTRDANSKEFTAYVTHWKWNVGLCVADARYLVRLANIDTGNIAMTGNLLIQDMVTAYYQVKNWKKVRGAIYCNKKIAAYLHLQALDSTKNSTLTVENAAGKPVTYFLGLPIRISDAITNTESVVS